MRRFDSWSRVVIVVVGLLVTLCPAAAQADSKLRVVLIVPFDATPLEREEQWMGEGVSQILGLGLTQHPAFVQIERARLRGAGLPETWTETAVAQAARAVRADAVLFGRIERRTGDLAVLPRLLEVKA